MQRQIVFLLSRVVISVASCQGGVMCTEGMVSFATNELSCLGGPPPSPDRTDKSPEKGTGRAPEVFLKNRGRGLRTRWQRRSVASQSDDSVLGQSTRRSTTARRCGGAARRPPNWASASEGKEHKLLIRRWAFLLHWRTTTRESHSRPDPQLVDFLEPSLAQTKVHELQH